MMFSSVAMVPTSCINANSCSDLLIQVLSKSSWMIGSSPLAPAVAQCPLVRLNLPLYMSRTRFIKQHRYDRTWGQFFETFEQFLGFSWPVITVTDSWTGRAHIVTRLTTVGAFIKMIKTRYVPPSLSLGTTPLTNPKIRRNPSHTRQYAQSHPL